MTSETIGKSEYIRTFLTERPKDGIDFSQARLVSALKLNDELAEYFKDRAHIEDTYAKSIAKLSKKHYISNKSALGTFLPIWEMLQMELSRLAAIHGEYSNSIIENVEQPLRSSIHNNKEYSDILKMEEHIHKIAREHDDLENKIQKHKKSAKGEAKVAEFVKQKEQNANEWNQQGSQYLQKFESVEESRLNTIKFVTDVFEALQRAQAEKLIELTTNTATVTENIQVADEIAAFCASFDANSTSTNRNPPLPQSQSYSSELINIDNVVPEPSLSSASLKQPGQHSHSPASDSPTPVKKEKKRFFSSLVSIRRKPKSDAHGGHVELGSSKSGNRQRSFSNAGSFVDSASLHSINTHSTADQTNEHGVSKSPSTNNFGSDLVIPVSPTSINPPSLRKASSFNGSFTGAPSSQPAPLIVVDSEGYSIPPPDRAAWPLEASTNVASDSILETDEMESDAGSLFSNNPRIRVDIKNESVSEEDASQSAVALTRVATLLKEKNATTPPTSRRLRGRREMRATQLYSVIEQDQSSPMNQIETSPIASAPSSPFMNPFEISQEKIVEEQPVSSAFKERLPQIDVHIVETVHVISRGGEAERSVIWGEISLSYDGPTESATPICFQINHSSKIEKVESTEYVSLLEGYDSGTYKLNTQALKQNESAVCIKYQTKLSNERLPIIVKPMWKCDTDKSRLLIKYQKNQELPVLNNVIFYTSVTGDVQNALSIPAGELILSQKKIKWHIGQIEDNSEAVIKAQFTTLEQASPQPIIVRFDVKDSLLSDVNVNNGVDALVIWAKVLTTTKTVKVGKYIAEI